VESTAAFPFCIKKEHEVGQKNSTSTTWREKKRHLMGKPSIISPIAAIRTVFSIKLTVKATTMETSWPHCLDCKGPLRMLVPACLKWASVVRKKPASSPS